MSDEKLKNTKLANMDNKILKRKKSKNLGITSSKTLQKCNGNKIISMDILNSVLSRLPGICSKVTLSYQFTRVFVLNMVY